MFHFVIYVQNLNCVKGDFLEPSYIVENHDDKKQEEEVNFKSTVEFKFQCEDNLKEDIQVQRRGPDVQSLEDGNMHGGTEDNYAAVQQPCTTRKFPISFSKNTNQIKMPSTRNITAVVLEIP